MVGEKSADIAATGADTLLAGDLGCLMNMAGKLQREGSAVRVRHVAEVLAGMGDMAADRRAGSGQALMESTAHDFKDNVDAALADPNLQDSLAKLKVGFSERRRQAAERLPEFEALRDRARDIKNHALANLDFYLEEFERKVTALGGHVHWAPTAEDARRIITELCQSMGARTVAKSKSMVAEEIALNEHLEAAGHRADRDRSRRIHHPAAPRAAQPHHRAGGPSHQGPGRRHLPRASQQARLHQAPDRAQRSGRRGALRAAPEVPRRRCRPDRRQLPGRRDRLVDAGDQRGQCRSLQHAAAHAHRAGQHREGDPHARGRRRPAARAGALGDRPGIVGLHHAQHRPEAAGRSRRARALSRRHPRQRPLRRCWAPRCRTCCAASAAAPA